MSTNKSIIHEMIDALPEEKILILKKFLEELLSGSDEDQSWLEADLGELPLYDWGKDGPPKGKLVKYHPGVGLVVREN
jgi:hypothetical protein